MGISKLLLITTILAILFLSSRPATSQELEDEREFSYDPKSETGPQHWGELHEDWAVCGKGMMQSPIDISDKSVIVDRDLGNLHQTYRPADAVMVNRGHDIELKWKDGGGGLWLNGTEYVLNQVHWHSPSEHTINGHRYSLELHMVHESADGKIAVVGILYEIGQQDAFLAKLEAYIKKLEDMKPTEEVKVGVVDPREINWRGSQYYRYRGSLTTPPCTEGVVWTIIKEVNTVSKEQVNLLREAVHDGFEMNARPLQEINGRIIALYLPWKVKYLNRPCAI